MIVSLLLEADDINPNLTDNLGGRSPLACFARDGYDEAVELLLSDTRVDPDSKDHAGHTPLSTAVSQGENGIVRQLIATEKVDVHWPGPHGDSLLSIVSGEAMATLIREAQERRLNQAGPVQDGRGLEVR